MTGHPPRTALLRQIFANQARENASVHFLSSSSEVLIGRDLRCHIALDSQIYGGVSRQHARVSPFLDESPEQFILWQICDLGSSNGTYVNGQRVVGCRILRDGDRIVLGHNGPQFIFEYQPLEFSNPTADLPSLGAIPPSLTGMAAHPPRGNAPITGPTPDDVTVSQLFPIVSTGRDLARKAYLIPGILTVTFVILLFVAVGNAILFNILLASYIAGAAYYFVYQLCGKYKPWWVLVSSASITVLLLSSPVLRLFIWVFRGVLPGAVPDDYTSSNFFIVLVQMFFGAGLMEELLKALPILLAYFLGTRLRSPLREQIGVWEPLDGILIGTASAVGFTLLETLGQYVPEIVNHVNLQAGGGTGELVGLQLLIPRILGSVSGHMAYSGYLGYFIGLSILIPAKRWQILGVGYLTASTLHALWNATGILNLLILALVGMISYAFLAAAILKARALSPTRSQNFATRFSKMPR